MATRLARPEPTMVRPDRRRPEPLWHQVEQSIRSAIESGRWSSGSRLPGEDQLTEMLGVSRITVRHALANLKTAGILRREHGRGTFVRAARLVASTRALTSFSEEMTALGLSVSTRVLDVRRVPATDRIAEALEILDGTAVFRVRRLRFGGQQPIGIQTAHLRLDRIPDLTAAELGGGSLYTLLRERYGIQPAWAEEVYRVAGASSRDAELLGIDRGHAVFMVERITSDERGPFEYTLSTMRGDRYEIRSTLRAT